MKDLIEVVWFVEARFVVLYLDVLCTVAMYYTRMMLGGTRTTLCVDVLIFLVNKIMKNYY